MGCMSTKLVPEAPPNAHLVETVYGQDATTGKNRNIHIRPQTDIRDRDPMYIRDPNQKRMGPNDGPGPRTNKKVKKYRDKFDPRVTAKYDIKALIGKGSFSRVVRVEHRMTKQPYAIKMIDKIQGREVLESELNVLRRVKHIYIIQLVEVFEAPEKVYMVMELATGGELFDRIIAKGSFTEHDAIRVLIMVLEGVKYLHGLGITHRDLKPENLLYYHPGHESKIMITDFGLSAMVKGPDNLMRTACGTPEYIAPEILALKPYTCQVDLWAIGVITYILLSGTMPFDDENRTRLYTLIIKAKYNYAGEHWKDISAQAKDFIDKTLVLDPNDRLTASQARKHPWLLQSANSTSSKNLHRTISENILQRRRANSPKSDESNKSHRSGSNSTKSIKSNKSGTNSYKSIKSNKSNRSGHSLRSDRRRVQPEEIDELHKDPELQADLASLASHHSYYAKDYILDVD